MRGMDHESGQARSSLLLSFEKFTKFMLLQSKGFYKVKAKRPNVMRELCRNYADENNQKINIGFRKKLTMQKRENWNRQQKSESWNLTIDRRKTEV